MPPSTMIVVASEFSPAGPPLPVASAAVGASLCRLYVQAWVRFATFLVSICARGEYPVPAKSYRYIGQLAPVLCAVACWVPPGCAKRTQNKVPATTLIQVKGMGLPFLSGSTEAWAKV